jgi:hypothetical protein
MVTEGEPQSSCPLCHSGDVKIDGVCTLPETRPLPDLRADLTYTPTKTTRKAISHGDVVIYSPEGGVYYFSKVVDIWTAAAYAVGTLPGLTFKVGHEVTEPVRHISGRIPGEEFWAYPDELSQAQAQEEPKKGKNGRRHA